MKTKIWRTLVVLLAFFCLNVSGSTLVSAHEMQSESDGVVQKEKSVTKSSEEKIELTEADKLSMVDEFISYGVDKPVAWNLVKKFESGKLLDSLNPEAHPVSVVQKNIGETTQIIKTYPDGSIVVSTTSNLEAVKRNSNNKVGEWRDVYGCKFISGGNYAAYWKNCTANVNLVVVSMGFQFDYESVRDQGSKITDYRAYHHHIIGASLSNFRFDRISDSQVRLSADLDVAFKGFPMGWTAWMQVNVSGSTAYTTNN